MRISPGSCFYIYITINKDTSITNVSISMKTYIARADTRCSSLLRVIHTYFNGMSICTSIFYIKTGIKSAAFFPISRDIYTPILSIQINISGITNCQASHTQSKSYGDRPLPHICIQLRSISANSN